LIVTGVQTCALPISAKTGKAMVESKYLRQYLEFVPADVEQRARLATVLSDPKVATTAKARRRAEHAINEVLARDPQQHPLRLARSEERRVGKEGRSR